MLAPGLGAPLADLVIALGFAIAQLEFQERVRELGLEWTVPLAAGCVFSQVEALSAVAMPPVCYMDDAAVAVMASSGLELFDRVRKVTVAHFDVARRRGLQLKSAASKTEAILRLASPGLQAAQSHLSGLEISCIDGELVSSLPLGNGLPLRLTQTHKHL